MIIIVSCHVKVYGFIKIFTFLIYLVNSIYYRQIHLHTQTDIPRMKDLAFAAAPGSHAMASVTYQYVRTGHLYKGWGISIYV